MKYSYIADKKLRNIMISANRKRRFSTNFLTLPKGTVSNKKIPVYARQVRKKHLNKVWKGKKKGSYGLEGNSSFSIHEEEKKKEA